MEPIWQAYTALLGTRQIGMAVGPITYAEIAAYNDLMHAGFGPWDVSVIRRLDAARLRVTPKPDTGDGQISMKDTKAVGSLLRGLKAKKEAQK